MHSKINHNLSVFSSSILYLIIIITAMKCIKLQHVTSHLNKGPLGYTAVQLQRTYHLGFDSTLLALRYKQPTTRQGHHWCVCVRVCVSVCVCVVCVCVFCCVNYCAPMNADRIYIFLQLLQTKNRKQNAKTSSINKSMNQ